RVDARGCPSDSDGDGVYDGIDRCPDTPAGARVDARGCPSDSDGDGVYDGIDRCPNTPKGTKVDKRGCPVDVGDVETQLLDTGMIRTSNILFETNKADLKPESRRILDEIGGTLQQWPELKIEIGGHTDSRGAANYNQTLSERRANAVRDYLVSNFAKVKSGNLSVAGYGESQAIASNDTVAGRAKNRRVEFKVLNEEELKRAIERRKSR
ncbi:MAG: OmpA family protein, partial [Candidatus Krumholzibacteria bacterium]|nr:OmpA family protein [Candidatus Krumholzibacteria bacterium]